MAGLATCDLPELPSSWMLMTPAAAPAPAPVPPPPAAALDLPMPSALPSFLRSALPSHLGIGGSDASGGNEHDMSVTLSNMSLDANAAIT